MQMRTTRIAVGIALNLPSAHNARLQALVIPPIRALLSRRISELRTGSDGFMAYDHELTYATLREAWCLGSLESMGGTLSQRIRSCVPPLLSGGDPDTALRLPLPRWGSAARGQCQVGKRQPTSRASCSKKSTS